MSDIRINPSPCPVPKQTEATESRQAQVSANATAENAKNPNPECDQDVKSGLEENVLQHESLSSGDNDLSNAVEAGMQSASEWLLGQGKLMQSEVKHGGSSGKHTNSPGPIPDSSIEKN